MNPGTGDLCDRLTILALKIAYGRAAGRSTIHFETERAGLLTKIRAQTLNGSWFESVLALGAVNAQLWQRTEEMRRYVEAEALASASNIAQCGMAIMRLNDQRAVLIATINELTGEPFQEKL